MIERTIRLRYRRCCIYLTGDQPEYLRGLASARNVLARMLNGDLIVRLAQQVPPGHAYLDVGANIGATAIPAAALCPGLRVFAFEPVGRNAALLRRNISANHLRNISVEEVAVGDTAGRLHISDEGPWSSVRAAGCEVRVTSIDEWYRNGAERIPIGLIKIDTEGYEPRVLAGAQKTLRRWSPPALMEFNAVCLRAQGFDPVEFARYLLTNFDVEGPPGADTSSADALVRSNVERFGSVFDLVLRAPVTGS